MSLTERPRSCLTSNIPGHVPNLWIRKQSWKWTSQIWLSQPPAIWVTTRYVCLPRWDPVIETDKSHPHCAISEFLTHRMGGYDKRLLAYSNRFEMDFLLSNTTGVEYLFIIFYKPLHNLLSTYLFNTSSNSILTLYTNQVFFYPQTNHCFFYTLDKLSC